MSKGPDFLKFSQSGGRLWTSGSLLLSVLVVMSACLGASGQELRINWYIADAEVTRLGIPSECQEIIIMLWTSNHAVCYHL